jgi:FixJ family two-component response regulator
VEGDAPLRLRVVIVDDHATYLKALEAVLATASIESTPWKRARS